MEIKKENNQYYGRYIERGVSDLANHRPIINHENFNFTQAEIEEMNNDILSLTNYFHSDHINYIGNHTGNADGDLIVDEEIVEIKYTNGSMGTYLNASMNYLTKLGLISYTEYLQKEGYYDNLIELGITPNFNNISPVSKEQSSIIRKTNPVIYETISAIELQYRISYVNMVYNYLNDNPDKRYIFIKDMITKMASNKETPDRLVVFSHSHKWIREFKKTEILSLVRDDSFILSGITIKIPGVHFTFGWQNGTGLNNPTIRVFLEG